MKAHSHKRTFALAREQLNGFGNWKCNKKQSNNHRNEYLWIDKNSELAEKSQLKKGMEIIWTKQQQNVYTTTRHFYRFSISMLSVLLFFSSRFPCVCVCCKCLRGPHSQIIKRNIYFPTFDACDSLSKSEKYFKLLWEGVWLWSSIWMSLFKCG